MHISDMYKTDMQNKIYTILENFRINNPEKWIPNIKYYGE